MKPASFSVSTGVALEMYLSPKNDRLYVISVEFPIILFARNGGNERMLLRLIGGFLFGLPVLWGLLPQPSVAAEQLFALAILDGRIAESAPTLQVSEGDEVVLELTSDRDLELHLHGYDLSFTLSAGLLALWRIPAVHSGRFPLEAHGEDGSDRLLLYLEVHPD